MKTRSAFFWAVAGQLLSFLIGFAGSVIVARLLSPVEMGTYVIGIATIGLISSFVSMGVGTYIVREPVLTPEVLDTAFTLNAILALCLSLAVFAVSQVSEWVLGSRDAGKVLMLLAVTPALGAFIFRPATLLQRDMNFRATSLIATVSAAIGTGVTIATAFNGASYMAPAWGNLATTVTSIIGNMLLGSKYLGLSFGLKGWREILTFGLRMLTISGAATMSARMADISLGRFLGLNALGLYSRASSLSGQVFDNVYQTATGVAFVHLSAQYRKTGEIADSYLRIFRMITAVMWPIMFGLAILSPVVIYNLYGAKWMAAALPFSILLIAQVVALFIGMNWELFVIKNETALQTRMELYRNGLGLLVFAIGCLFSIAAAAVGRICDFALGVFMYRKHVTRLSGVKPGDLNAAYREGMTLSLCAVTPVAVLMAHQRWSEHTSLLAAAAATALGVAMWAACLVYFKHPLTDEMVVLKQAMVRMVTGRARSSSNAG